MRVTLFFFAATLFACSRQTPSENTITADSLILEAAAAETDPLNLDSYSDQVPADTSKVMVVDTEGAILVYPTDEQIEAMKKEYGEDDFYTVADDATFYQATASVLLDSLKVKTFTINKSFLKLVGGSSSWTLDVRRKGLPEWNIIFFHRHKTPEIVSTPTPTAEHIQEYFQSAK